MVVAVAVAVDSTGTLRGITLLRWRMRTRVGRGGIWMRTGDGEWWVMGLLAFLGG